MKYNIVIVLSLLFFNSVNVCSNTQTDSLLNLLSKENDSKKQIVLLHNIYKNNFPHNLDSAIFYAEKARNIAEKNGFSLDKALSLKFIGNAYLYSDYYNLALKKYLSSLNIYKKNNDEKSIVHLLNNIAYVYKEIGEHDLALEYLEKTLVMQSNLNDSVGVTVAYGNIGTIYSSIGEYDKSIECINILFNKFDIDFLKDNPLAYAQYNNNLGYAYYKKNEYKKALKYYKEAILVCEQKENNKGLSLYYNNVGYAHLSLKKYEKAQKYFFKSLEISTEYKLIRQKKDNYFSIYELNNKIKDYKTSTKYLELYIQLSDSIISMDNETLIEELRLVYDINEKEIEIQLLESKEQSTLIKQYILIGVIVVIIIIGFLIFGRLKSQKRIMQAELEKRSLKSKLLNKELQYKSKQLTDFALHIIQRNNLFSNLRKHVKSLKKIKSLEMLNNEIKKLDSHISYSLNISGDREEFNAQIELVNQTFFQSLESEFPHLTENEKKVSALLRLKLSSKEIAALLNISSKSVDTYRYNIRKKLNLNANDNLYVYLSSIK